MAFFKIKKGTKANLPSTKEEGQLLFTTDEGKLAIDISNSSRIEVNAAGANKLIEWDSTNKRNKDRAVGGEKKNANNVSLGYVPVYFNNGVPQEITTGQVLANTAAAANKLNTDAGSDTQPVYFKDGVPVMIPAGKTLAYNAQSASKLTTNTAGSSTQPVYFNGGIPVAITGTLDNNVQTANKLSSAKSIALGNLLKGSANFDGSAGITISANYQGCMSTKGQNNNYPWAKIGTTSGNSKWADRSMLLIINEKYRDGCFGIIRITLRSNDLDSTATDYQYCQCEAKWLVRSGFDPTCIQIGVKNDSRNWGADIWYKHNTSYSTTMFNIIDGGSRSTNSSLAEWTLINPVEKDDGTHSDCVASIPTANYNNNIIVAQDVGVVRTAKTVLQALNSNSTTATTSLGYVYGTSGVTSGNRIFTKWTANLLDGTKTLEDGMLVSITIPVAGCSSGCGLSINGTTEYHPVVYNTNSLLTTHFPVGTRLLLLYDKSTAASPYGTQAGVATTATNSISGCWRVLNLYTDGNTYTSAYCSTAAATTAKTASCSGFVLQPNSYIHIIFTQTNTASNPTLNIQSTGAHSIKINDKKTPTTAAGPDQIKAGSYIAFYDGTDNTYNIRTDGKLPGTTSFNIDYGETLPSTGEEGDLFFQLVEQIDTYDYLHDAISLTRNLLSSNDANKRYVYDGYDPLDVSALRAGRVIYFTFPELSYNPPDEYAIFINYNTKGAAQCYNYDHTPLTFANISHSTNARSIPFYYTGAIWRSLTQLSGATKLITEKYNNTDDMYSILFGHDALDSDYINHNTELFKNSKIKVNPSAGLLTASIVENAVWNDYAEYRIADILDAGYCVKENGDDTLSKTNERLSPFAGIISDTFGFSEGQTDQAKTPIAVAGRVLAYPYQDRNNYKPGDCVCAAPNGTVDIMTREEIIQYPDRIVGIVSCVPNYKTWGSGNVAINGRIWIKVK